MALGWVWWRAWSPLVARDAAALCVAGVALGDIDLRFGVAGVAFGDIHLRFAWQSCRWVQSNVRCARAASSGRPCNQTACSVSLWVRRLWNSCHLLFAFFYSSTVCGWLLAVSCFATWCSPIMIAAVVALTQRGKKHLHRVVSRHCACVPAPSRAIYGRLSPRWPEVQDHAACVPAWGQRLVLNQVWLQGRQANALCWAHIEALAGQFASLWLPDVPPCSQPRRLGGRLSHTTFAHATLSHTTLLHATFSHTTRSHSYSYSYTTISQLPHTQLLHTQLLHPHTSQRSHAHIHIFLKSTFVLIDVSPPPLSFLPSPSRFKFCC